MASFNEPYSTRGTYEQIYHRTVDAVRAVLTNRFISFSGPIDGVNLSVTVVVHHPPFYFNF